ncbi:MAG: sugar nucleotide-binding protein [Nanoarchaeota archaeon]|nr:sugar nucleotide-binding protein [Nanoarchaeota archaeon]
MNLIIGASGYVGTKILEHRINQEKIVGTFYNTPKKDLIYFNLKSPNLNLLNINLNDVKYGFICSAISNIDECKKNEKEAYKINVLGIEKILQQFFDYKITPIFFSSDGVFDGGKGDYKETDEVKPCTVYGKHKKIIEDYITNNSEDYIIFRLSKIIGTEKNDKTLLTSWLNQLINNKEIPCATDQTFSPVYVGDLINSLDIVLKMNLRGIYHIAPQESFTKFQLANILKSQLEINAGSIRPCLTKEFNFLDSRPLNTSMNCEKFVKATGYKFQSMKDCIWNLKKLI